MKKMIKTYSQLCLLETFEDRFKYLKLDKVVGWVTFGFDRQLNQAFYKSREWKAARRDIIIRDDGCDLGIKDRPIFENIIVHHMNPLTIEEIEAGDPCMFDPNNLICVSHNTHNALAYGDLSLLARLPKERVKGDTSLWEVYSRQ